VADRRSREERAQGVEVVAGVRNDGLDVVRGVAMIVVVAGHAAVSFMVTPVGWAVQDRSQHLGFDLFVWLARAFAMPTFFWLSGYFARAVLETGGIGGYARHRVVRILVPLAVAVVPCSLVLAALWDRGRELATRAAVADNVPKLQGSELPIVLGHLWFLYYLLWLSFAALLVARAGRALGVPERVGLARGGGPERAAGGGLGVLAVPATITFGVLAGLGALHTDTPMGFVPDVPIGLYMGAFFAWGWMVRARPEDMVSYRRWAWRALAVAAPCFAIVIATLYRGLEAIEDPPLVAIAASALFTVAGMVGFLGLGQRAGRPRRWVRLASESSYWFYIAHLPIVVALQLAVAGLGGPGLVKCAAIVAITTVVCVASYGWIARAAPRRGAGR
jgi:glucans biosynthesis protein C